MDNKNAAPQGLGFFGVLQIVFIVLRLCNIIKWSWFWVLAPIEFCFICFVALIAILLHEKG